MSKKQYLTQKREFMTNQIYVKAYAKFKVLKVYILTVISIALFGVFFIEAPTVTRSARESLTVCYKTLIPSLFPFMVVSYIASIFKIDQLFSKLFGSIFEKIFKSPKAASSAFAIGIICGFPAGTKSLYSLYEKGEINNNSLMHLLLFCNIQSMPFIVNTVGGICLNNTKAGIFIYLSQIISLVTLGVLYPRIFPIKVSQQTISKDINTPPKNVSTRLTDSIKGSTLGILSICGFVVFFSTLSNVALDISSKIGIPSSIPLLCSFLLEMSGGCFIAAKEFPSPAALVACSSILAFSGFSMHFQIMSLCPNAKIKYSRFFAFKILQAVVAGIAALLFNIIFRIFP